MQQPRGPATLCIKAKEIDALYDALGKIQRAFAAAAIPWTLTGGSALGAVRSASILFCDDDIDLAVLGREHFERARRALRDPRCGTPAGGRNGLCWDREARGITKIGKAIGPGSVGECVGLYGVSGAAVAARCSFFLDAEAPEYYEDSFDRCAAGGPRRLDMVALDVTGFACVEVDDGEDLAAAVAPLAPSLLVADGAAVADGRRPSGLAS
ncbi:hypothetical protein JL720_15361 [Aureococcus anophagefferens]|nr:hypothetical protein JL720_15361 [Aureococcus anophagefferens]